MRFILVYNFHVLCLVLLHIDNFFSISKFGDQCFPAFVKLLVQNLDAQHVFGCVCC